MLALFLAGSVFGSAGNANNFHWSGRLAQGQSIEIKAITGDIHAERAAGDRIDVTAEKTGADAADVRFEVVRNAGGVTICTVYAPAGKHSLCAPGSSGRLNAGSSHAKVNFVVHVPRGVRFAARTENGYVQAVHLGSDVEAHTINGKIVVSTSGAANAETVNGSIQAATGIWQGSCRFSTVNGNIELEVPKALQAEVSASTVYGQIDSDLPVAVRTPAVRRVARRGPRALEVTTVYGSIILRRRGAPTV